jgi:hypothetical protein
MKGVSMFDKVNGSTKGAKGLNNKQGSRGIAASPEARRPLLLLNDIRDRAYEKWATAGMPPGDGACFWMEAEQEMRAG